VRISYELTAEDVVAAVLLHYDHSRAMRLERWATRALGPMGSCFFLTVWILESIKATNGEQKPSAMLLVIAALGVPVSFLLPWLRRKTIVGEARRRLKGEHGAILLGTGTMEIVGTRLACKGRDSESAMEIRLVKDIAEYEHYALIYLTPSLFHTIPFKSVLPEEEYRAFVAALRQAWKSDDDCGSAKPGTTSEHIRE
jgi:hypothetical protein